MKPPRASWLAPCPEAFEQDPEVFGYGPQAHESRQPQQVMNKPDLTTPVQYFVRIDYPKRPEHAKSHRECDWSDEEFFGNITLIEQMKFDGKYDWSEDGITASNFSIMGKGDGMVEIRLELIHLDMMVNRDKGRAYLKANGLRAAWLSELLAFGAKYPEVQRKFPIVALGSRWGHRNGIKRVAYLDSHGTKRCLCISYGAPLWRASCRFLAVRIDAVPAPTDK